MHDLHTLRVHYEALRRSGLKLDLTRGKPSEAQLDLSTSLLKDDSFRSSDGLDCRNYGCLEGLPEARELFAGYFGVADASRVLVIGNSSLALMYNVVMHAFMHGVSEGEPWRMVHGGAKMLCPSPGYDRHHAICEHFGIGMIPVPFTEHGPDMDVVEQHIADPSMVGMWCVPQYSNPTGHTYDESVVLRLARMQPACPSFLLLWDLAYAVHHLVDDPKRIPVMLDVCREYGCEDRVIMFGSTSKITFASAGLAAVAASTSNCKWIMEQASVQMIGSDKLSQLRHAHFFQRHGGFASHMQQHREILETKFAVVQEVLQRELGNLGIASWSEPEGGYFVSLYLKRGSAKRVVELACDCGVALTPAGAAFPYGKDPNDAHIRIAPSYPSISAVGQAMEVLALCVKIAAAEAHEAASRTDG